MSDDVTVESTANPDTSTPAAQDASPDDIETILRREAPDLLRYLQRRTGDEADAADLLSELFMVAWRRSADLPRTPLQARLWLFGVARRTVATHRRGIQRRTQLVRALSAQLLTENSPADVNGTPQAAQDPRAEVVQEAMSRLRERDREILALVHWHGFTLTETATLLTIRPGTARTRYQRARQRLASLLRMP